MSARNPHIGETFESFLRDEGIYDEVVATITARIARSGHPADRTANERG